MRLQVVSPRCPCGKIDQSLGKTYSIGGVRALCARTGLGGFFIRVLHSGDLQEGDVFMLAARPNPAWTVGRVSHLLYGHPTANMNYLQRAKTAYSDHVTQAVRRDEWMGTEDEMRELAALPQLAVVEYKEHLHNMLGLPGLGRYRPRSTWQSNLQSSSATLFIGSVILVTAACLVTPLCRRSK